MAGTTFYFSPALGSFFAANLEVSAGSVLVVAFFGWGDYPDSSNSLKTLPFDSVASFGLTNIPVLGTEVVKYVLPFKLPEWFPFYPPRSSTPIHSPAA